MARVGKIPSGNIMRFRDSRCRQCPQTHRSVCARDQHVHRKNIYFPLVVAAAIVNGNAAQFDFVDIFISVRQLETLIYHEISGMRIPGNASIRSSFSTARRSFPVACNQSIL